MTESLFGNFPQRPEVPDFWRISSILLKLDAGMQEAEMEEGRDTFYENNVTRWVDSKALHYSAMQRAIRPLGIKTQGDLAAHVREVTLLSTLWAEGFMVGAEFVTEPIKSKTLEGMSELDLRLLLSNYEKHVMERARAGKEPLSVSDFLNSLHSE